MIRRERLPGDIRARLPRLAERFRGDPLVVAVYLFGSFARGTEDALSDLDIALLLDAGTTRAEANRLAVDYAGEIIRLLGTDEVSLVILNGAPLPLRHEIVAGGRLLLDNVSRDRAEFDEFARRIAAFVAARPPGT